MVHPNDNRERLDGRIADACSVRLVAVTPDRMVAAILRRLLHTWPGGLAVLPDAGGLDGALRPEGAVVPPFIVFHHLPPATDGIGFARRVGAVRGATRPKIVLVTDEDRLALLSNEERGLVDGLISESAIGRGLRALIERLAREEGPRAVPDLRGMRVLLAEDNDVNRAVACGLLAPTGCEIAVATNGAAAVDLIMSQHFDLVLMDIYMPVLGGLDATACIRAWERGTTDASEKIGGRVPILAMTADSDSEEVQRSVRLGMDGHLTKPIDVDLLYETLHKWRPQRIDTRGVGQSPRSAVDCGAAGDAVAIPSLPGLDVSVAVARMGGDRQLYMRVLRTSAELLENGPDEIAEALRQGDIERAARGAHTAKGTAGSIGASDLAQAAANLEAALRGHRTEEAGALLERLRQVVGSLMGALAASREAISVVPREASSPPGEVPVPALLDRLAGLLAQADTEALEVLRSLDAGSMPATARSVLARVRALAEAYDFGAALAELDSLADADGNHAEGRSNG